MKDYLKEIILSFKETSKKDFVLNLDQDLNSKKITKSIEIVYGLRNFIGNANKFSKNEIEIRLRSNIEETEIIIKDEIIDCENITKEFLTTSFPIVWHSAKMFLPSSFEFF